MTHITDHLADIERRIAEALERSDRTDQTITIVGVSKRQPAAAVVEACEAGLTHFGENYLQEGLEKIAAIPNPAIEWHFIGRVQSNKTRSIAEHFSWVETLDRPKIADRLSSQRPDGLAPLNVLVQLDLDEEPQKGGIRPGELLPLARHIAALPRLKLRGIMNMPPVDRSEAEARAGFLRVAAEAANLRAAGFDIDTISMGMSSDYELAIECGSTSVRIGTALFGPRAPMPA